MKQNRSKSVNSNKTQSRGKRSRNVSAKPQCSPQDDMANSKPSKGSNDVAWYDTQPGLMNDAANLAFMYPSGESYDIGIPEVTDKFIDWPGVQTMELMPSVGYQDSPTSPLNIAAMSQYTFVRKNKAGSLPFDAPDLMCLDLAMADIYSYINYLFRLYSIVQLYSMENMHIPETLLIANKVDAEDLRNNLPDFRYGVNLLMEQAAAVAVPATTTIYARRAFLYQNVYTEGTSIKDQLYMYVPYGFLQFNDGSDVSSGTRLKVKQFHNYKGDNTLLKVADLLEYGNELIQAVYQNADVQTMSAFNLEAYGEGNIIKLQPLGEVQPLVPIFNIGVLEQMRNATIIGERYRTGGTIATFGIRQDETRGYLVSQPAIKIMKSTDLANGTIQVFGSTKILSTTSKETNSGIVMESSRLMLGLHSYEPGTSSDMNTGYLYTGTEVAMRVKYWQIHNGVCTAITGYGGYEYTLDTSAFSTHIDKFRAEASFKFSPATLFITYTSSAYGRPYYLGDVDNFTLVDNNRVKMLHQTALMSLLNVPRLV